MPPIPPDCVARPFGDSEILRTDDARLNRIAAKQTLARWRHEGRGPAFHKCGSRVFYTGADLNAWIRARRIKTDN